MGSLCCTSGCAWGDTWPWGRGCTLRVSFQALSTIVQRRGRAESAPAGRSAGLSTWSALAWGLREVPQTAQDTQAPFDQIQAHSSSLALGIGASRGARTLGTELGELGRQGGANAWGLTYLPQLSLPPRSPSVPAHSYQQRQLGFAKYGLAPPEKRREPAKAKRAQFLEKGPPELGKGNAMNSAKEVNI